MGTILVVDDEPTIRELLVELLRDEGHTILGAVDGLAAMEVLEHTVPDLVITDAMMPRRDGSGLVRWMREQPDLRPVPVIILSAVVRIDSAELDDVLFVAKPFDLTTLLETIAAALDPPPA
ncbi:MAG: response regulator [Chloroflexota bacterium]|nr:response regulator [Chloroflexota bacterium]